MTQESAKHGPQTKGEEVVLKIEFDLLCGLIFPYPAVGIKTDCRQQQIRSGSDGFINPQVP